MLLKSFIKLSLASLFVLAFSCLSSASYFSYKVTGSVLAMTKFQTAKWFQRLFPMSLGILKGRNATMVNNIEKSFTSENEITELLAIVGKAHIPEMKLLLENLGYFYIPLPTPSQMEAQDNLANNLDKSESLNKNDNLDKSEKLDN